MNNKIMFVHLMKTGGSSVKKWFIQTFKENAVVNSGKFDGGTFLSIEQMNSICNAWGNDFKYYLDHKLSFFITKFFSNVKTFTIVRNPVDKFISYYNFLNNETKNSFFYNDVEGAIKQTFVYESHLKGSSQIYHLSQGNGFKLIENVVNNLDYLIIPFEYIEDVPLIFGSDKKLGRENVSNKLIEKPDEDLVKRIEKYTEGDQFLYDWSKRRYERNRDDIIENWSKHAR